MSSPPWVPHSKAGVALPTAVPPARRQPGWGRLRTRSRAGAPGTAAASTRRWQTGEERLPLLLRGLCPVAGPGPDPAFSVHRVGAALLPRFITRRINNPARWAERTDAKSLRGCLPPMNGHNPLNNERLLCLCLSFWQGCSFQVLLITGLLVTLRFSIAGWPSQPHFCMFSTSKRGCGISVPPDRRAWPYLRGWSLPATVPPWQGPQGTWGCSACNLSCLPACLPAARPRQHNSQPNLASFARTDGCCLGPKPQTCPESEQGWVSSYMAPYGHRHPSTSRSPWVPPSAGHGCINASALAGEDAQTNSACGEEQTQALFLKCAPRTRSSWF